MYVKLLIKIPRIYVLLPTSYFRRMISECASDFGSNRILVMPRSIFFSYKIYFIDPVRFSHRSYIKFIAIFSVFEISLDLGFGLR